MTFRTALARPAGAAALAVLVGLGVAVPVGIAGAGGSGGGGGGRGGGPAAPVIVRITVDRSRFTPASVDVARGATVRFVIRNLDPIDHEFIIGGPEVHRRHEVGREARHPDGVPGAISVAAGETVSTTWTAPTEPGPVAFACHLPGHLAYGMAGVVQVTS